MIGSVVYLKSGSPPMTVNGQNGDSVEVEWFAADQIRRGTYSKHLLTEVVPDDGRKSPRAEALEAAIRWAASRCAEPSEVVGVAATFLAFLKPGASTEPAP